MVQSHDSDAQRSPLTAKRVLVVRPEREADRFIAVLEKNGAKVTHTPVMAIEPISDNKSAESQAIRNLILELDNFHKAIVVSGNAAELALEWFDRYWPMLPVGVEFFAIGQHSAEILAAENIVARAPNGRQNSEVLLALPQLEDLSDQRVIIFRGCGGREILGQTLSERGARVDYCELYRREIIQQQVLKARHHLLQSDCLVAHSGELLQAMGPLPVELAVAVALVVPSERVAAIARDLGYQNIVSAENALPESMLAAVEKAI